MEHSSSDLYLVFLRDRSREQDGPEQAEQPVAGCASYAEARQIQRLNLQAKRDCVIRYAGPAGGGD